MITKNVLFSLTIIFSVTITLVFGDCENPPSGNPPSGHPPSPPSGGGSGDSLTVVVSYESLNQCSQAFFKKQLTSEVFEEFSKCKIDWKVLPCSTSKVVNAHLTCWEGEEECVLDRMYACATKLNEDDMKAVGKFVICMHQAGNKICSAQNCANSSGFKNWDAIDKCSKSIDEANGYCQKYWGQINDDWQITDIPGIMTPPKFVEGEGKAALEDFKGFLCKKLKEKNISCAACGGSSGGGSNGSPGGGSPGGGTPGGGTPGGGTP